jgi:GT2 family glycosyltransferase
VIVATRNRSAQLAELLPQLAAQATGGAFTYDVLVVDNGSSDDTRRVVEERRGTFPVPLGYAYERQVGKPYALNAGVALASGRIFAFTDDDARPTPTWLRTLWSCLLEEPADAATGRVLPHWLAPRPAWLTDEAFREIGRLGCLDHGPSRQRTSERQDCRWVGSNLAIRREAVQRLGGWDERLEYLQDTDYYRRAVRAGLNVVYEPEAVVYHKIGPERLTPRYFRRRRRKAGFYLARQAPWSARHLLTVMPWPLYAKIGRSAAGWVQCTLRGSPWWQRFQHELSLRESLGTWWHRLRLWPRWWLTVLTGRSFMP